MSLDHLLLWLSARGAGSWSQFRAAVEELHVQRQPNSEDDAEAERPGSDLPVYHEVRFTLQRLAHVEFRPGDAGHAWRVVPPSLALMPGRGARGLLCGARSVALLERLGETADLDVSDVEGMPQRVVVRGESEADLAARARALGLHIQESAPVAILCAVPGVRETALWATAEVPATPGWTVHRFSPLELRWTAIQQDEVGRRAAGLFRFVLKHQRFYYLRWRGRTYQVPVQVGKYAVMGRRQAALSYDANTQIFSVPAVCRPPLLIERALVLCSGILPRFDPTSSRVEYIDVPRDVVRLAAQLLCQEVR
ncbi:MAG: hypothetical protein AB1726_00535 [Planctomycetota bacterium]